MRLWQFTRGIPLTRRREQSLPPIYLSTTFERDVEGTYSRGHMYTRNSNPNRVMLERGIATLEGGVAAAAFASGMAAATRHFPVPVSHGTTF